MDTRNLMLLWLSFLPLGAMTFQFLPCEILQQDKLLSEEFHTGKSFLSAQIPKSTLLLQYSKHPEKHMFYENQPFKSDLLDAPTHLFKRMCSSLHPSVPLSFRPSGAPSPRRVLGASYAMYYVDK